MFEKRERLMDAWASYCALSETRDGIVTPIRSLSADVVELPGEVGIAGVAVSYEGNARQMRKKPTG